MDLMITNPVRAGRGGQVGAETFADIPGFVEARWQGWRLRVRFDRDLTVAEQQTVRDRCESATSSEATLRAEARTYSELKNPSAKDDKDQIRRLTRLVLGENGTE